MIESGFRIPHLHSERGRLKKCRFYGLLQKKNDALFFDAPNVQMYAAEASYDFIECRGENTPAATR